MRDGVLLRADIFVPAGSGRWPTILIRTPYNRHSPTSRGYRFFAERGFAVVTQDVRGRYGSQGIFGSVAQEGPDGNDTLNWIPQQSWSNGKIGMTGASYVGIVQWWAAVQKNPHLVTIFPIVSGDDEYMDRYYSPGGALKLAHRLVWLSENLTPPGVLRPPFDTYIRHLPLRTSDIAATTQKLDMWRAPLAHPSYDRFWTSLSIRSMLADVNLPVSSMAGWFDNYGESDLDAFSRLAKRGLPVETWIGPWSHTFLTKYPTIDFGPSASPHIRTLQLTWFNRYLKEGKAAPNAHPPTLHIFVMGPNVWREEHEWPLRRTQYTPYYLDSGGQANSAEGDGKLVPHFGEVHRPDHFVYSPKDPVPTRGGAVCCNPTLMPAGPLDQTEVEKRRDVLVYTSAPLREDLEVTGPVGATIYVASSANDTDFSAKLVDVSPEGHPLLVTDGITRMRYRMSLFSPVFMRRNTPYQVHINVGVTSWVFERNHRIRLEISSSNFPRFDRNLNSSRPTADETKLTEAAQTIYHEKRYPSVLVLPVIPRVRSSSFDRYSNSRANSKIWGAH
jgi:putative CocE/NonD family hydrolase